MDQGRWKKFKKSSFSTLWSIPKNFLVMPNGDTKVWRHVLTSGGGGRKKRRSAWKSVTGRCVAHFTARRAIKVKKSRFSSSTVRPVRRKNTIERRSIIPCNKNKACNKYHEFCSYVLFFFWEKIFFFNSVKHIVSKRHSWVKNKITHRYLKA